MKKINQLLFSSIVIIVLILGITIYIIKVNVPSNLGCGTVDPKSFCGTEKLAENTKEGKDIFNSNCAACHKLDAKSTGPALRATDSITYWKWLIVERKIDTTKIDQWRIDYHHSMFSKSLNEEDLKNVYQYISK